MDTTTARAILSEAASGGWLDKPMPEDENDLKDLAQFYYDEARMWKADGNPADDHINAIINLGLENTVIIKKAPPVDTVADTTQSEEPASGEIAIDELRDGPIKLSKEEGEALQAALDSSKLDYEGLPVPEAIPETQLNMPPDLTEVGDKALRRLYSTFNAYSGRARWMLATANSNLANATHLRDDAMRTKYLSDWHFAKKIGDKLSQATLENMAKDGEEYKQWNERVKKHEEEVTNWRALLEIYSKNVEVLSREWTMRTEQYERER